MIRQTKVSSALVDCLKKIEAGSTVDQALIDYPHLASQLREILYTAQDARQAGKGVRIPSSAQIDSRQRLLVQAQAMKKRDKTNFFWPFLRFFNHYAGSFTIALAAVALLVIALGSTRALPGDSLYPVKIVAEQAEFSIYFSPSTQIQQEESFDNRRVAEINQMIVEKRTGAVHFAGFLEIDEKTGWHAAGVSLKIPSPLDLQSQALIGTYVDIKGFLNDKGAVDVKTLQPQLLSITGTLQSIKDNVWQVNNLSVKINSLSQITGTPRPGSHLTIQAARTHDPQQVLAILVRVSSSDNLETTEPIENTLQAATAEPTKGTGRNRNLAPSPTAILTPEPSNDGDPVVDPTHTSENEDDHKSSSKDH